LGILAAVGACQGSPPQQVVTVYVPSPLPGTLTNAFYQAYGDFEPTASATYSLNASLLSAGTPLTGLPAATRSLVVSLVGSTSEGVSLVPASGPVNVLALPTNVATQLPTPAGQLGGTHGPSVGLIDSGHVLIIGGPLDSSPQTAFVLDLGTGELTSVTGASSNYSRDFATITPFPGGAIVAGGTGTAALDGTAEVYQAGAGGGPGGFGASPRIIPLSVPRSKHAAVALANGDTLLVGGENPSAATPSVLSSLELLEPSGSQGQQVGTLKVARTSPSALLLPGFVSPRILVGGGLDANMKPVSTVEWFDVADASSPTLSGAVDLCSPPSLQACCPLTGLPAFAPLEGGAVLVVLAGTPPKGCQSNVLLLRNDFRVEAAPLGPTAAQQPRLFAGAQSEPVYFSDSGAVRWDPWNSVFDIPLGNAAEGSSSPVASLSADPGLALWLGGDSHVWGLRFDTRNAYSTDMTTLLSETSAEFAPDRLVKVPDPMGIIDISPFESGVGVTLRNGGSVYLTDATFADFTVQFTPTGSLTLILLDETTGTALTFDQSSCLPVVLEGPLLVTRSGGSLSAAIVAPGAPATPTPCAGAPAAGDRVALGFQAPSGQTASVSSVLVTRVGPPN
jgi:hypothetical protein